jgi:hypothetical protein
MVSKNDNKTVLATLAFMLLSLSLAPFIAISTPHYASAQGVLEGLEREQSGEALPGDQPADIGGPTPLNATTTLEGGGNATNATMTGAAGNATNATMTGAAGNATNATMTGAAGNATTTGGATNTTTGPGGIGTDDPGATDNPFSDLT